MSAEDSHYRRRGGAREFNRRRESIWSSYECNTILSIRRAARAGCCETVKLVQGYERILYISQ